MTTATTRLLDPISEIDEWAGALSAELEIRGENLYNGSPSDADSRFANERMGAAGIIGLPWPESVGGRNLDPVEVTRIEERLGYHWLPLCGYLLSVKTIGSAILRYGSPELIARFLPDIVSGRSMFCQGFSEPDAGSDLAALRTRAEQSDGGWVVNGHKIWTSSAEVADWMYLAVRTGTEPARHRGLSVMLVDMRSPGIEVSTHDTLGGGTFGEVILNHVAVPAENVVGEADAGWEVLLGSLDFERVTSEKVGVALRVLDDLEELTSSTSARRSILALRGELETCRRLGHSATRLIAAGRPVSKMSSMCKLSVSTAQQKIAALAGELLGPTAFVDRGTASPAHGRISAFIRAAVSTTIAGGASDIQRKVIARQGLGLPR